MSSSSIPPSRAPTPPPTAEEVQTCSSLFRQPKPPTSRPRVPCLRCAIVDLHCVYYAGDTQCQRCARNAGVDFCIFQREDLTRPEAALTWEQESLLAEGRKERRAASAAAAASADAHPPWLSHRPATPPSPEPALQCMVYTLDAELSQDRTRMRETAQGMLAEAGEGGAKPVYVHGTPVTPVAAAGWALPMWHQNDWPENRAGGVTVTVGVVEGGDGGRPKPPSRVQTHQDFFEGRLELNLAAAEGTWRLGRERRKLRERKSDEARREREEREREEKEKATREESEAKEGEATQEA